jgi:hypothetical protein
MKTLLSSVLLILIMSSCQSQPDAYKEALKTKNAIEAIAPGSIPTKAGEFTMTAKIDGRAWKASGMMPVEAAGRFIGSLGKEYISLPRFEKKFVRVGKKEVFGHDNAVDLAFGDAPVYYSGYSGEMEVTKIDGEWIEAKFSISASNDRTSVPLKITDGFVRVKYEK